MLPHQTSRARWSGPPCQTSGRQHYTCYYIKVAGRHIANMTTTNLSYSYFHACKQTGRSRWSGPPCQTSGRQHYTCYYIKVAGRHIANMMTTNLSYSYFHACKQTGRCCRTRHHELAGPARPARQAVVNIIHIKTL
ncbi:hypothetical protein J6590_033375 [Homalodisca vitripennis]|nr:hypothetical protein J6590_033375 [Homalodisca vitripennis]